MVVTRFPPSPTGYFHIGSARTALFNYLFTAHHGGVMYLRFEDTDKMRSKKEYEDDIISGLEWLGIPYTKAEPLRQTERLDAYRASPHALSEKGAAYEAEEAENGKGKVVRFKNPNTRVAFSDLIRGDVVFDTTELKDFIIARNLDDPLYHMAVVADDHDTGVTHIIRGEDHISNTQRQILILEALGFERPIYAHIPLILAPDRSKLSKRHGAVSVNEYRTEGYLPEALVNYLALLGWNPGGEKEIYTLEELVRIFSFSHVQKGAAIFSIEKLRWFNHEHIRRLSDAEFRRQLTQWVKNDIDPRLVPLLKERSRTVKEAADEMQTGEFAFIDTVAYDANLLLNNNRLDLQTTKKHLEKIKELMTNMSTDRSDPESIRSWFMPYADAEGRGNVLWPIRVELSGKEKSPDPFTIIWLLGNEKALQRIDIALRKLQ